jgi:hypothetical protein
VGRGGASERGGRDGTVKRTRHDLLVAEVNGRNPIVAQPS